MGERELEVYRNKIQTETLENELRGLDITEDFVIELAKKYQVSSIALTIRLEKMGYCFSYVFAFFVDPGLDLETQSFLLDQTL